MFSPAKHQSRKMFKLRLLDKVTNETTNFITIIGKSGYQIESYDCLIPQFKFIETPKNDLSESIIAFEEPSLSKLEKIKRTRTYHNIVLVRQAG